ncbi:Regulator of telomere elongation helicase 1-like isoform x2, partial [Globisporangium splendens]
MVRLEICGIPVEFPFPPYDSQLIYMEKVILSLSSKQNAILESPTGTGKTLCLLCATLAWRRHFEKNLKANGGAAFNRRNPTTGAGARLAYEGYDSEEEKEAAERAMIPRIIYSSRTHSQLKQVVQELRNTSYNPRVAVLGSREHLCVNEKISQMRGTKQNLACRDAVRRKSCVYKRGFDNATRRNSKQSVPILDIEELVETMKEREVLAYIWQRSMPEKICPFFLSRSILPDAEIVFVPYNYLIDPLSRRSIGISIENSILIFDEAHNVESIASDAASYALSSNDIAGCVAEVQSFIQALSENRIALNAGSNLSSEQFNVNFDTCPLVLSMIEEIIELANEGAGGSQAAASKLDSLLSFLGTIFRNKEQHLKIWVGVVGTGVTGKRLNSSYNFRSTDEYLVELGNTIVNFTRLVPSGLLVFFPSYSILEESITRWQRPTAGDSSASIWDRIVQQKQAFVEPRARQDFKEVVDEYHETIKTNTNGAVFFAVCRGKVCDVSIVFTAAPGWFLGHCFGFIFAVCLEKVSEGIDFSNDKGRAVVITGLPFPPTKDPKIILKKSILDEVVVAPGDLMNVLRCSSNKNAFPSGSSRIVLRAKAMVTCERSETEEDCGEAHIGLTRFFKSNKANAPPPHPVVEKATPQPKSLGLSKRMVSKNSFASQDSTQNSQARESGISSNSATIGDGQSYVNPELFRHPAANPASEVAPANAPASTRFTAAPPQAQRKQTLGALFSSKTSMVSSTSSISRPFVAPKSHSSMLSSINLTSTRQEPQPSERATSWQAAKRKFASAQGTTNSDSKMKKDEIFVSVFPAVARSALSESDVSKLYGFIRQLHAGTNVDDALSSICDLLRSPECQDLLNLIPQVLHGTLCDRFVDKATSLDLPLDLSLVGASDGGAEDTQPSSVGPRSSSMATFFERLEQKRRRKQNSEDHVPTAAIVKDPQCVVCYDITRKAYAAQCGHICCMGCWKKMEKDGFTSCPLCKIPLKFDQLSLIRAAKEPSSSSHVR